jgi:hypothetical protein
MAGCLWTHGDKKRRLRATGMVFGSVACWAFWPCNVQNDMTKPGQRWRPISLMPAFKYAIGSAAETARTQAENMCVAMERPDLVDRVELARMRMVYEDTASQVQMCRKQLQRWCGECATPEQVAALGKLADLVKRWDDDTKLVLDAVNSLLREE